MSSRVAILIPTKDRPERLERLLQWYGAAGFEGRLLIGDASQPEMAWYKPEGYRLDYHHWPGCKTGDTLRRLSEEAGDAEFCVYSGDDDYLLPAGLTACVEALDEWAPYNVVAAHGAARWFRWSEGQPRVIGAYIPGREVLGDTAAERVGAYLERYWPALWCVTRGWAWREAWAAFDGVGDPCFGAELGPSALVAVLGKVGQVEAPYLLREKHDAHERWSPLREWVKSSGFAEGYAALRRGACAADSWGDETVADALRDGLPGHVPRAQHPAPASVARRAVRAHDRGE